MDTSARDTKKMREYFDQRQASRICIWSEKCLEVRHEVDHRIPYPVWGNNDLWNLLPADARLNQAKRDALPSPGLLQRRRDRLIDYWQAYRAQWPERFNRQVTRALGGFTQAKWELQAFAALQEVVERLAVSRGLARWEPQDG